MFAVFPLPAAHGDATAFADAVNSLVKGKFKDKERAVSAIEASGDERSLAVLKALLAGDLYYRKSDRQVVYREKTDKGYHLTGVLSNEDLGVVKRRAAKKIGINNKLRGVLRGAIARLSLTHPDPARRLAAAREMLGSVDAASAPLLRDALAREGDGAIAGMLKLGLALVDSHSPDAATRLGAIAVLGESLEPAARNRLQALLQPAPDGAFAEPDARVRKAAARALSRIQERLEFYEFLETVFFGLSLGSVLLLAAIGLAITFGVMGVINMAHGELIMLGAYTTYVVQLMMPDHIEYSLWVAIPAAFLVAGLVGVLIERGVIRFLYGRPLETLLATFGISLILQQLVRTIFSPLNRSVATPEWLSGSWAINSALSLTYNRLYIIIFALLVFALLFLILKRTRLGLYVRAVSQNRAMAKAVGVRSEWVDALTFGLGSGIAGVAGVALSQLTNVGPNLGQAYIIDSFMVVVFGGVGNLWGTLVGAMSLGVANKFLEPWAGAVLAKILILVLIILFIQKRPRGLFPQQGRAVES
ncbi:MAG TPA: urea ABC transporter permease subunit UrtB [Gammaproteobacteria bacterium]|nr:urea ABC transporter permease subunit UrtB [Gammaproteobacteria bacterium]